MINVDFSKVNITGGFWADRECINANVSLPAIKQSYLKTKRFAALKCNYKRWKFWQKPPHVFYDSDVAKWIEAVAYVCQKKREKTVEDFIDSLVLNIKQNQKADGYFNSHFNVVDINKRFSFRTEHELYCAGHLIEAAIAYYNATGKSELLNVVEKYVDLIDKTFRRDKSAEFSTPGHPEIELALVKLYKLRDNKKYLDLAEYFINARGTDDGLKGYYDSISGHYNGQDLTYAQDHAPVREQKTAEGHCVRACYLYSAMVDIALLKRDNELLSACNSIFKDIVDGKLYITGGIGAKASTEGFDKSFILPNDKAYTETCAAISLIMFAHRLSLSAENPIYADVVERALYNGILSGVSLKGDTFFYENPLEIYIKSRKNAERYPLIQRQKDFSCSCCPPNLARTISSVGGYAYKTTENIVYIEQYLSSTADFVVKDKNINLSVKTDYPNDGKVEINIKGANGMVIAARIPAWCKSLEYRPGFVENGYVKALINSDDFILDIYFDITPEVVFADDRVKNNAGKVYVRRGPIIYCAEAIDNPELNNITLHTSTSFSTSWNPDENAFDLTVEAFNGNNETKLKLIPYFAFANRGESDMKIYIRRK